MRARALVTVAVFGLLFSPINAQDMTFYLVDSLGDEPAANPGDGTGQTASGAITLRSAMMAANVDGKPSVIEFDQVLVSGGPAEVVVGSTLPTITTDLEILGLGADQLTIRSTGPRIFIFQSAPILQNAPDATLADLTITGSTNGAVLNNQGNLTVQNSVLRDNNGLATGLVGGGAIDNQGGGNLLIRDSVIGPNNTAEFSGALDNYVGANNRIVAINSTFVGNEVSAAGAVLYNGGGDNRATFLNCTIANNTAGEDGGALYQEGELGGLTLVNSTVVDNSAGRLAGGIYIFESTNTLLINTIVAGNTEEANAEVNIDGTVSASSMYNFIGEDAWMEGILDGVDGNQIGTASAPIVPQLMALADNGGSVPTMLPMEGSPVIDEGSPVIPAQLANNAITTDARGEDRLSGSAVDVGAVEVQAEVPPIPGDYDGDGTVSVADVTALGNHIADGAPVDGDPDYNDDGTVDSDDLVDLARDIANGTVPAP